MMTYKLPATSYDDKIESIYTSSIK